MHAVERKKGSVDDTKSEGAVEATFTAAKASGRSKKQKLVRGGTHSTNLGKGNDLYIGKPSVTSLGRDGVVHAQDTQGCRQGKNQSVRSRAKENPCAPVQLC